MLPKNFLGRCARKLWGPALGRGHPCVSGFGSLVSPEVSLVSPDGSLVSAGGSLVSVLFLLGGSLASANHALHYSLIFFTHRRSELWCSGVIDAFATC